MGKYNFSSEFRMVLLIFLFSSDRSMYLSVADYPNWDPPGLRSQFGSLAMMTAVLTADSHCKREYFTE